MNSTGLRIGYRFEWLLENLALTQRQRDDGRTKHQGVRRVLNREYHNSDSALANSMLVGSWGKGTVIRPPRDIDVLFVLPFGVFLRYVQRTGNRQSQLLQEVKTKLLKQYPDTAIGGDGQVVSVPFTSYAVEVVPAFALPSGQYWICDSHGGGRYRVTDPKAEQAAIEASDLASGGNTRDLTRILKCWQDLYNVELKSFWLEILARLFVDQWPHRGVAPQFYPHLVRDFFAWLVRHPYTSISAAGTGERMYLGAGWLSKAQSAHIRAAKAVRLEAAGDSRGAGQEWQKIFGFYIPL